MAPNFLHAHIFATEGENSLGACAVAFERGHRPASEASLRPKCGVHLAGTVLTIKVLVKHPRQTMPWDEDVSSRATSETTPSCASCQNCFRSIRRFGTRVRLPCNTRWPAKQSWAFIATPGDEHTPFCDCIFFRKGMYRSAIAAVTPDGGSICRGRAALRRVEYLGHGGGRTRAALRRAEFSVQEVDGCLAASASSSGCWVHDGSRCFLDCQTPRRCRHGVDVKQALATALTMRNWCCTPSGMMN